MRFAKCGPRVFLAEAFFCFGFFIESSVSFADRRAECIDIYASSEQSSLVLRVADLREELVLKAADHFRLSQDVALHRALEIALCSSRGKLCRPI